MHMIVERVSYLHEGEIEELMNKIKHSLRPDEPSEALLVQRAVTLVRNGAVSSYTYEASRNTAIASIRGVDTVDVNLFFATMNTSCSCGYNEWCSHRIAVIFHLYLQHHSLTDWLHEWRRIETEQMVLKIADRSPGSWNDVLVKLMQPIRAIELEENPAVFIHKFSLIEQKAIPLFPFEWEWKPLFDVYYRLQALDAAWPYVYAHLGDDSSSFSYGKWYVKNWITDQLGKLLDSVVAISSKPRLFQTDAFHKELQVMVRTFTLSHTGLFPQRFQIYKSFWQNLFTENPLRKAELEILQSSDEQESHVLIAFFQLLQDEDANLTETVQHVDAENFSNWLALADFAESDDRIDSLEIIMRSLLPFIGDYLAQHVPLSKRPSFVRKIDGLLEATDFPEADRESMFSFYGQAGLDVYADFLVERERFKEWAALMHRYNVSYELAEAGGLKVALLNDPAAVLPLLHTYAAVFINEKNRQSYRRAVKVFKKMKAGAKKSGKADFWNRYIDAVRTKNRRLRALMEEMEKGNLNL
ncbi:SWIM zinc finger family protein [Sporosarcina sp. CAU 1771]